MIKIDLEEFKKFYPSHSNLECEEKYNLTSRQIRTLCKKLNLETRSTHKAKEQNNLYKAQKIVDSIDKDEFIAFFYTHSNDAVKEKYLIESEIVLTNIRQILNLGEKDKATIAQLTYKEKTGLDNPSYSKEIIEKRKETRKEHFGEDCYKDWSQKVKKTCDERYGNENYNNREQCRETCLQKYGVENVFQSDEIKHKIKSTLLEKYGDENYYNYEKFLQTITEKYGSKDNFYNQVQNSYKEALIKKYGSLKQGYIQRNISYQKSVQSKYGVNNVSKLDEIKKKVSETVMKKYGVEWACQRPEARQYKSTSKINSLYNDLFCKYFDKVETEFALSKYSYDFKIDNRLIEINPTATHNSTWGIFNNPKEKYYHFDKTLFAQKNRYECINVWDWDDINILMSIIQDNKIRIGARQCDVKKISDEKEIFNFLNVNHLQGTCRGQSICLGLYYNDELVQIMTFGKPRYNSVYQYELLRLCTRSDLIIIGGAQKLFTHFIKNYNPTSIISYCDNSKFSGNVYLNLGMQKLTHGEPGKHWYNIKTKQHITDNLLRQRGYDQLFGTNYGKGTSNEALMIENGFVEIYDCGQSVFVYNKAV